MCNMSTSMWYYFKIWQFRISFQGGDSLRPPDMDNWAFIKSPKLCSTEKVKTSSPVMQSNKTTDDSSLVSCYLSWFPA